MRFAEQQSVIATAFGIENVSEELIFEGHARADGRDIFEQNAQPRIATAAVRIQIQRMGEAGVQGRTREARCDGSAVIEYVGYQWTVQCVISGHYELLRNRELHYIIGIGHQVASLTSVNQECRVDQDKNKNKSEMKCSEFQHV